MGPLSDPRVIELIARNFVPVATNLYKIRARKDEAGDFFRAVQKQKDQYQGFWIVTPTGTVLAAHQDVKNEKNWTNEVLAALRFGLERAGPLPPRQYEPRELLPYRGKGTQDDGSVSLALCVRGYREGRPSGQGAYDTIDLSAVEWRDFTPPDPEVGAVWKLSRAVASRFSRCLSDRSDQSTMPKPEEVTQVEMTGTVLDVRRGVAVLRYEGRLAAVHAHPFEKGKTNSGQGQLQGIGTYDIERREMRYLLLVGTGTYREFQPYDRNVTPLAFVVEWQRRNSP